MHRIFVLPRRNGLKIFSQDEMAYKVKWKGYGDEENSWVRESDAPYVSLHLCGLVLMFSTCTGTQAI